ncbi:MAG: AAA family ATPase [bacterium]
MTQGEALNILKTGANVFLTGEPGSGKTHTVNEYVAWLRSHDIEPAITASTGIAATHIQGMTIHSWSGIGIAESLSEADLDRIASKEHVARRIAKTHVLIIDEVSMLSGEVLRMADRVCREVRRRPEPFGGLQVVLVGDFFQLPPVTRGGKEVSFAFDSPSWRELNPIICYLTEQHRQDDAKFTAVLSAIRAGDWDQSHVSAITSRETDGDELGDETPRLFTHNADVDRINGDKLAGIKGNAKTYEMESSGSPVLIEALKRGCLSPETLTLKEGAIVMCTKNNQAAGYVNGTLGTVIGFSTGWGASASPIIETKDGRELTIEPADWAVEENGKVRAKVTQVPLRLAWAITVHKSQGMSMDSAAMDLSRAFEYGQGYVALSRVRSLDGLHLLGWSEEALRVHPAVAARDAEFREASLEAGAAFSALEEDGSRETMERNFIKASGGTLEAREAGKPKPPKRSTYEETLALIEAGKTIEGVAAARALTFGTITDHVEKLVKGGKLDTEDVRRIIPVRLHDALPDIFEVFRAVGAEKLAPAFARLGSEHGYDDLRLARLLYERK